MTKNKEEANMYTYDSFVTDGSFTLLRPIFITFLMISITLFLIIFLPKAKQRQINGFTITILSFISLIVTVQLTYFDAIIVDEIGLSGDNINTFMCFTIIVFSLLNPIIYYGKKKLF